MKYNNIIYYEIFNWNINMKVDLLVNFYKFKNWIIFKICTYCPSLL